MRGAQSLGERQARQSASASVCTLLVRHPNGMLLQMCLLEDPGLTLLKIVATSCSTKPMMASWSMKVISISSCENSGCLHEHSQSTKGLGLK